MKTQNENLIKTKEMSLSVNSVEDDESPLLSSFNPSEISRYYRLCSFIFTSVYKISAIVIGCKKSGNKCYDCLFLILSLNSPLRSDLIQDRIRLLFG